MSEAMITKTSVSQLKSLLCFKLVHETILSVSSTVKLNLTENLAVRQALDEDIFLRGAYEDS